MRTSPAPFGDLTNRPHVERAENVPTGVSGFKLVVPGTPETDGIAAQYNTPCSARTSCTPWRSAPLWRARAPRSGS